MRALCLLAISFSLFGQASADQVSLKNGDRLSGTIVKSDGKNLLLHTDYAGDVSLKWDAVQGIESAGQLHVELQDGTNAVGTVTSSDDKLDIGHCYSRQRPSAEIRSKKPAQ